jgi:ATP-dependent Lhr-like helicase
MLAATGQVVWVGRAALGGRDGRVSLYLREHVRALLLPPSEPPDDPVQCAILGHLADRGASFLFEIEDAVRRQLGGIEGQVFKEALWELVWDGQVSNDTFAPLRSLGRRSGRSTRRRWNSDPSLAAGRWSRVDKLADAGVSGTERAVARANMLLDRYGVVSREMAALEALPGGFGPIYKILSALEESGRVRRGYFIEGLSGAQFARPGCIDRLRGAPAEDDGFDPEPNAVTHLPVTDPANPWGGLLPWPETGDPRTAARPRRIPGARLLMWRGRPLLYLGPNARQLITFPGGLAEPAARRAAFQALLQLPKGTRRRALVIEKIDGRPARESGYCAELMDCGFVSDYRGLAAEGFA